jgi:hypothetical protein
MAGFCDKCRTNVPDNKDAVLLDVVIAAVEKAQDLERLRMAGDLGLIRLEYGARHLFPVEVDGEIICPGSPSRAQYIEGQPRDDRYEYSPDAEARYRAAFKILRELKEDFIFGRTEEQG